jgi:hypothetical protein
VKTNLRWRRNRGVVMPEYVIVVGLVAIAAIASMIKLQTTVECQAAVVNGIMPEVCIGKIKPIVPDPKPSVSVTTGSVESQKVTVKIAGQIIQEWYTGPTDHAKSPWDEEGDCFVAGTPVMTDHGLVPIEQITAGTHVLSRAEEAGDDGDDPLAMMPVTGVSVRETDALVRLEIRDADGGRETLEVTPQHRVYAIGRGWVEAASLAPGRDRLLDATGAPIEIASGAELAATQPVYNFEVEATHTYYVGQRGTWVHNAPVKATTKPKKPKKPRTKFSRVSWRKPAEVNAWNNATKDPADPSKRLCPTCSKSLVKADAKGWRKDIWDIDHQGATWAERVKEMKDREAKTGKAYTRDEVIDNYHKSPLRLQCSQCNQGHGHEPTAAQTAAFKLSMSDPN